jgi:signal peptidase I
LRQREKIQKMLRHEEIGIPMFFNRKKKSASAKKSIVREYLEALLWAVVLALLIRTWGLQAFKIPSSSMEPTLLVGDHLLVSKSAYGIHIPHELDTSRGGPSDNLPLLAGKIIVPFSPPARGDIIVFRNPENREIDFIKRVIGLPGEKVAIRDKIIYINDEPLPDPWGRFEKIPPFNMRTPIGPLLVPPGHYFVMGDNRDHSHDSRYWFNNKGGFVPEQDILGKALILYWSWDGADSYNVRWSRLLQLVR